MNDNPVATHGQMQNNSNSFEVNESAQMLHCMDLSMDHRDPLYHQVQKDVTTGDVDFWLGIEKQPQIQKAILQDYFNNLVDIHESEDQWTDVTGVKSSFFEPLKEPFYHYQK